MKPALGAVVVVIGLAALAWGGFTYTTREKVIDVGPIHATREKTHDIPVTPVVGLALVLAGAGLIVASRM